MVVAGPAEHLEPQSIRRLTYGGVLADGLDGGAILQDNGDGFLSYAASLDNISGRTGRDLVQVSDGHASPAILDLEAFPCQ